MKPIDKDELYQHLSGFLKSKGIDLKDGSYTQGIQKSCTLLSDAINLSQTGLKKAKTQIDQKLEQVRQVIHEKTAPKPPPAADTATAASATGAASAVAEPGPTKASSAATRKTKSGGSKKAKAGAGTPRKPRKSA